MLAQFVKRLQCPVRLEARTPPFTAVTGFESLRDATFWELPLGQAVDQVSIELMKIRLMQTKSF
ncbi:hypothetical protein DXX94_03180 [Thalassotalea euphylliae]|uniref:Uncharacterized protein n=1 Tax=Thalassotalea euphylliae TaxID=1655234 RepID=A0A3E0TZC4_9GAMM|nr:hypothetical protein DXX94_03180 [Thalassotalea euphylliae]